MKDAVFGKRFAAFAAALLTVLPMSLISCRDDGGDQRNDPVSTGDLAAATENDHDDLPELDYLGEEFTMLTFEEPYANMLHVYDEPSDDTLSNAKYNMIRNVEQRLKIKISETAQSEAYVNTEYRALIASGVDDFDIVFANDRFAHYFAEENVLYKYADLPYIDLTKDYWDQSLLGYTTVGKNVYYAYGTYDFTYYDLTHCLVFNKALYEELNFKESPYDIVRNNEWTLDKMYEMASAALLDNGDDVWTKNDRYGYVASGKQILPNFWISCGTTTVSLDKNNMPYLTMENNERLLNIIEKCFDMFWDSGVWCVSTTDGNQAENHAEMFIGGKTLFADYTFYFLNQLRECEDDFGILPYPKFDGEQKQYYSRVEAGTTMVTVPITNPDPERASAVIEAMASEGYKRVRPAYYESVLKRRNSRDEESGEMLDLIFATRVYDLGDTWYCDQIRDGIMKTMWNTRQPNFASMYRSFEKMIKHTLNETISAYMK